jgi:hypothetical protein
VTSEDAVEPQAYFIWLTRYEEIDCEFLSFTQAQETRASGFEGQYE